MYKVYIHLFIIYFSSIHIEGNNLYSQNPDFNYREPYFLEINTADFAKKNKTHRLDDQWGIWGHNLLKLVNKTKHSNDVYAFVDGKRNKHQFCFSSSEIEKIILNEIANSPKKKFVIAPQDNTLACLCNRCTQKGNTKNNASPAVFSLLKKLALYKKKLEFYTLAYLSTAKRPDFTLPKNVGIFYSTINFQKGIPYENQTKKTILINDLKLWKKKTDKIIVWDYALNFDNYHEFYPNLFNIQKNISFLKNFDIEGIFFNGSEVYALLQDLKATIVSKVMYNTSINLDIEIKQYLKENYPETIANILIPYYLNIEKEFSNSNYQQGIYSNIESAKQKYLKLNQFIIFYEEINKAHKELTTPSIKTNRLLFSLTFLKLELIRSLGINSILKSSKKDIIDLLDYLKHSSSKNNILYINERKDKISNYIQEWLQLIFKPTANNILLNEPIKTISNLDEDYKDIQELVDGKFGFLDYNINWFLISKDDLKLELNPQKLTKENQLICSFLNDPKHQIYFPERITISSDEKIVATKIIARESSHKKKEIKIKLHKTDLINPIKIHITRRKLSSKSVMACDEIILKNNP